MSNKQRVTVCLCAYMHAKYIRQALEGLAAQTYPHFKIIACDDGSTDGTYEILKQYEAGKLAGKLTVLTHPGHVNRGAYHTYSVCLDHVETEFFVGHASDDFWMPDALSYWVSTMDQDPAVDAIYGSCRCVDDTDKLLPRFFGAADTGSGIDALSRNIGNNPLAEPSMFFRETCKDIKKKEPALKWGDWYHNIALLSAKNVRAYSHVVVAYRCHADSVSQQVSRRVAMERHYDVLLRVKENALLDHSTALHGKLCVYLWLIRRLMTEDSSLAPGGLKPDHVLCEERYNLSVPCLLEVLRYVSAYSWSAYASLLGGLPAKSGHRLLQYIPLQKVVSSYVEWRYSVSVSQKFKVLAIVAFAGFSKLMMHMLLMLLPSRRNTVS